MGHKVNPLGFRIAVNLPWSSKWFCRGQGYAEILKRDQAIRALINQKFKEGGVAQIEVARNAGNNMEVTVHVAKPGIVIGHGGRKVEDVKQLINKEILKGQGQAQIAIKDVPRSFLSAKVAAGQMASELERRMPFRRVMRNMLEQVMKAGAKGVKVQVSGRLNGAEIARTETLTEGRMPLQTLRAHIDYALAEAYTTYGMIGVKVWIYTGDIFNKRINELKS